MYHYITAEISRSAVAHNLQTLRAQLPAGCRLCAVVKANCYGHSLPTLLETLAAHSDCLGVATIAEALEIRSLGYEGDVMTTLACGPQAGGLQLAAAAEAIRHGVQLSLTDIHDVEPLARLAESLGQEALVHVKVDTGMGRSGASPQEAVALVSAVRENPALHLSGIFTHFAASDEQDKGHAQGQLASFLSLCTQAGPLNGARRHCANSAAVADMPQAALDMVRPGVAVYGYQPSDEVHNRLPLRPCLRLVAPLLQVKSLPAGATCGYGCVCKLGRDSRVGIVPAGYADGVTRLLLGRYMVGLNGKHVPVLGRISMDQIIIDLTDLPNARVGDTVELISPRADAPNSVENLARLSGTIPYEVTCRLGHRMNYKAVGSFEEKK